MKAKMRLNHIKSKLRRSMNHKKEKLKLGELDEKLH